MSFSIHQQPLTESLKKILNDGFTMHAIDELGMNGKNDPFAFIVTTDHTFVGAVVLEIIWGALHIKYLYVNKEYRHQGIAKNLIEKALTYGKEQQCPFAYVETFSFQAGDFYKKMGFTTEFTRSGYNNRVTYNYLRKNLN